MATKPLSAFLLLSLLLFQVAYVSGARKDPGDYWKSVMDEEAMPKAIQDLLNMNPNPNTKSNLFIRNFDVEPNVIIYHSRDHTHGDEHKP